MPAPQSERASPPPRTAGLRGRCCPGRAEEGGERPASRVPGPPRRVPLSALRCGCKLKPRGPSAIGNANVPQARLKPPGPRSRTQSEYWFRPLVLEAAAASRAGGLPATGRAPRPVPWPLRSISFQWVLSSLVLLADPSSLSVPQWLAAGLEMNLVIVQGRVPKPGICVTWKKCWKTKKKEQQLCGFGLALWSLGLDPVFFPRPAPSAVVTSVLENDFTVCNLSGSWWWTGRPGVLRFMGSQRVGHDWATEMNWTEPLSVPDNMLGVAWPVLWLVLVLFPWTQPEAVVGWHHKERCFVPVFQECNMFLWRFDSLFCPVGVVWCLSYKCIPGWFFISILQLEKRRLRV